METIGVIEISLNHDVQKIYFLADLTLRQKGHLRHDGLYNLYNSSTDIDLQSWSQLLSENANRMRGYNYRVQLFLFKKTVINKILFSFSENCQSTNFLVEWLFKRRGDYCEGRNFLYRAIDSLSSRSFRGIEVGLDAVLVLGIDINLFRKKKSDLFIL